MDRIPTFMLSTTKAYDYTNASGHTQRIEGVERGEASVFCLEEDASSVLMGNMSDAVVVSKEACEGHIEAAESGRIPENFIEHWGLDLPEELASPLPDAREQTEKYGGSLDGLKPATESSQSVSGPESKPEAPSSRERGKDGASEVGSSDRD